MTWVIVVIGTAVIGGWCLWPGLGAPHQWRAAPGGPLHFRLRYRAPLPWLLGADACAAFGTVHVGRSVISPYLLGHECAHLIRAGNRSWQYLAKYTLSPAFHRAEEEACTAFGRRHRGDPELVAIATRAVGSGMTNGATDWPPRTPEEGLEPPTR